MSKFQQFLKALIPSIESEAERNEAYLSEAVDLYDLERRMEVIERQGREIHPAVTFAQGLR